MKPPRRRMTTRAMVVATALFALDFAGFAWGLRRPTADPLLSPVAILASFFLAAIVLLFALISLYVPRPLDEALMVVLILVILVALIVPALRHS